jgi:hypothetical protein
MSNERNKSKLDKIYRTDPPLGQAGIPAPPRFLDEIESFGFDLSWRPMSYFEDLTLEQKLGSKIIGQIRGKKVIRDIRDEPVDPQLMKSELASDLKDRHGKIHPVMMGGEYLPDFKDSEVEICRVVLESTTMDVTSIRAKKQKDRIVYRVEDEYDNEYRLPHKSSSKPLTIKQLINNIDQCGEYHEDNLNEDFGIGLVLPSINYMSGEDYGDEEVISFVKVQSYFYPEIEEYYEMKKRAWLADIRSRSDL